MKIPGFEYGGMGPSLHFLHANGYPPACYKPLLKRLRTEYQVFGMLLRPLWPDSNPGEIESWHPFTDDLLRFLAEKSTTPVIGVGHSIGAVVTLRAALREPDRFRALVLIDPVLSVPSQLALWSLARSVGLGRQLHPKIRGAMKRRRTFDNLDLVFSGYRTREIFRYLSDESLRAYIDGITRKSSSGYKLIYSPEWESRIYLTALQDFDIWRDLPRLEVPTLFLRGAESDTFLERAAKFVHQKQPRARVEALPRSTHLLPLERPQEVFEQMQSFLNEVLKVVPTNE